MPLNVQLAMARKVSVYLAVCFGTSVHRFSTRFQTEIAAHAQINTIAVHIHIPFHYQQNQSQSNTPACL
jgi:hypothetical protein